MARPGERMRLKDRIIDNISKSIKSIQELVYYQYKDPLLTGCDDSVVLFNNNRLCHKLCENLDHTLLHGLKNVMRGYWRVVKQLSPHAMVREIDLLVNVTTDLGKGRAWLYASLNEGLLESYIRLLCDNDKLLKKYYAKEALVLDRDRMSVLLTLTSGLDCVTFKLEYDLPYLDLNAYPPRSRSNSEQDGDVSSDSSDSYLGHPCRYRSMSEVFSNSPLADFQLTNDSDSASLASLDVCQMKASTISADSGFPADGMSTNGTRPYTETVTIATQQNGRSADSASLSSLSSSSGDPDRHQRLENVSSSFDQSEETSSLEVIHMKGKKSHPGKSKRKKFEQSGLGRSDAKGIPSDLYNQEKYLNCTKVNLAVGERSDERNLKNMSNGSVFAKRHVVKNIPCDCRQREMGSDTLSDVSTTGLRQNPDSQVSNLIPLSVPSLATSNICAELSGGILPLSLKTERFTPSGTLQNSSNPAAAEDGILLSGYASSKSQSLSNSNTVAGQEDIPSSVSVCFSTSSVTSLVQDRSPSSELCGSDVMNKNIGSFPMGASLLSDSCVGDDQSFKSVTENPTALMCDTLGQPGGGSISRVPVDCEDEETLVAQQGQREDMWDLNPVSGACDVQSQANGAGVPGGQSGGDDQNRPDVSCIQSEPDGTCVQSQSLSCAKSHSVSCVRSQPDDTYAQSQCMSCAQSHSVSCVRSQPDDTCAQSQCMSCVQSQPDGTCVQSQPDGICVQSQPDGTCVQSQPDGTCVQSQPDDTFAQSQPISCVQSQDNGSWIQSQPDVPDVQNPPSTSNVKIQSGVIDSQQDTSSSCGELKSVIYHIGNKDPAFSCQAEDDIDVYSSNKQDASVESHSVPELLEQAIGVSATSCLTNLEGDLSLTPQTAEPAAASVDRDREEAHAEDVNLSLRLDNNMVLQLMLDVFCQEDEQFMKMFVTWENQAEGGTNVAYLLISNHCLYVLHYQRPAKKFVQHSCTVLVDIIFISVGLNGQTLNIESRGKNKQKQRLWLTPGNHNLSQAIVTSLAEAVKAANEHSPGRSRFSIGSEVPLQKIALRKYISKELGIKPEDVSLLDYSLVFWEDLSFASTSGHSGVYKDGRLDLWAQGPLKGHDWKPVYVVLKNNILSVKHDKSDLRPYCSLSLGGDQCVGCRLTSHAGRDHCVELILAEGGSWLLSGGSQAVVSEWRHCLCLAVSQGTVESDISAACVPCCAVLANQHLFLCHEDLYTKFHRTLARLQLQNVTSIAVDGTDSTYCIIKLRAQETGICIRQWAFYFYSSQDMERHIWAISAAWKDIHQTELPVLPIDDVAMECSCNSCSNQLKRQLTLS